MEVNGVAEAVFVPEATATDLDHLDPAVDALGTAIVGSQEHSIDDAPEMRLDGFGNLLHRFQSSPHCPG